ncbi:MAG: isoamylase [Pseudomonadota bacterium]
MPGNPEALLISRGAAAPLGATPSATGTNFAVHAPGAASLKLGLFLTARLTPHATFSLSVDQHRTGDVWHAHIEGLSGCCGYAYQVLEPDGSAGPWLLDPYARAVSGLEHWGDRRAPGARLLKGLTSYADFDWGDDRAPRTAWSETVIYELHVRGFTRGLGADVTAPGTYAGLQQKLPYLRELGVTAIELLPIFEFDEDALERRHPETGAVLLNYWGYDPLAFMAPKAGLAQADDAAFVPNEFKRLVKACHAHGIEVILDVVFNHTGEGPVEHPPRSWRGFAESSFYHTEPQAAGDEGPRYRDYSGCGNSVNCNHPVTTDLIIAALRHWVAEYHVDGFRFDLASVLTRGVDGEPMTHPPLIERMSTDPVLAGIKLIAEPWDAVGLHHVGSFPGEGRFAEWSDGFRDTVRAFVRGDENVVPALARKWLATTTDGEGGERTQINFVTCHDGFSLADLVAYSAKRNLDNGEANRDGTDHNLSWNCGVEGPTTDVDVVQLRLRQQRNFLTLLLLAPGTPMLRAGDEFCHTQLGNNNVWCQDNATAWLGWRHGDAALQQLHFTRALVRLRRSWMSMLIPHGRPPAPRWHGVRVRQPDWAPHSRSIALELRTPDGKGAGLLLASAYWEPLEFELPAGPAPWRRVVDKAEPGSAATAAAGLRPIANQRSATLVSRSIQVLMANTDWP